MQLIAKINNLQFPSSYLELSEFVILVIRAVVLKERVHESLGSQGVWPGGTVTLHVLQRR